MFMWRVECMWELVGGEFGDDVGDNFVGRMEKFLFYFVCVGVLLEFK